MKYAALPKAAAQWDELTSIVLDLKKIPLERIQTLLKETSEIINEYQDSDLIPRGMVKLFLNMEEFLSFASMMEENEVGEEFYYYREVFLAVKALKDQFFGSW